MGEAIREEGGGYPLMVLIKRYGSTPMGTFGELRTDGFHCYTLEREWKNNEPNISCIPLGQYLCRVTTSQKFDEVYEVERVQGRTHILIHPANLQTELQGCIALGRGLGCIDGKWAITDSRRTVKAFMAAMGNQDFYLSIERC